MLARRAGAADAVARAGAAAARRDGGGRRADARQHQVRRRPDPAGVRRRPGQARGRRDPRRPRVSRHRDGARRRSPTTPAWRRCSTCRAAAAARSRSRRSTGAPGQQPYQGVVPLHGDAREPLQAIAPVLEHYMLQSEQLDTRLVLAADDDVAAGLLLQRLPPPGAARRRDADRPRRGLQPRRPPRRDADARRAARASTPTPCCGACSGRRR